ncbi:MAG: flavodoxin domain-containing protein [Eubacteriales bacterium]|nr:flavodoxin domain-containing protein [Eubacteriales bacterium]
MRNILIAYVSKTGTTAEAAALIASRLEEKGFYTTVLPISEAGSLEIYDSFIIGGPINGMTWHPEASSFVSTNTVILSEKDVSFFCLSYMIKTGRDFWKKQISKAFDSSAAKVKPSSTGIFGGKIDKELPGIARFIFGVKRGSDADQRDNSEVIAWADKWAEDHK